MIIRYKWLFAICLITSAVLLLSGCGQKTVDLGTDRTNTNSPSFFDEKAIIAELETKADLPLGQRFLTPEFSNALKIRIIQVRSNKIFEQLNWAKLEQRVAEVIGAKLSLNSVDTAWFMLDSRIPEAPSRPTPNGNSKGDKPPTEKETPPAPQGLVALDMNGPAEQLNSANLPPDWKQATTTSRQLLIGNEKLVDSALENRNPHPVLGPDSEFWNSKSDLTFAIVPSSFAAQLERFSQVLAGQEDQAQMLDLMDSIKTIVLEVNLEAPAILVARIALPDADTARGLKEKLGPGFAQASNTIRLLVTAISFEDKELTKLVRTAILELSNPSSMKMEIKDSGLEIRLRRPSNFDELAQKVVTQINNLKAPEAEETTRRADGN